jgi:hypothetical protein
MFKIIKCTHVTATEKRHIKAFLESGRTSAKINTKYYTILRGQPIKSGYEYDISILTPYTSESTGQKQYDKQKITLQHFKN